MPDAPHSLADHIAHACLDTYARLPSRGKPRTRSNGVPEWTVLAGLVLTDGSSDAEVKPGLQVISLGTGVKCLPANRLPQHGDVLHDSHAEIIARRGFMLWLYREARRARSADGSSFLCSSSESSLLRLKDGMQLHMYVSTLPCGDASTLHLARLQDPDVAAGWLDNDGETVSSALSRGRQGYSNIGALRTKPARADAITTESLSCSDKLATWTVLGLQGALLSRLVEPIYIDQLVFSGVDYDLQGVVKAECERALFQRLGSLIDLPALFKQTRPDIAFTTVVYPDSKEAVSLSSGPDNAPASSGESLSWIEGFGVEALTNGVKQGGPVRRTGPQKASTRSRLSRLALYQAYGAFVPSDAVEQRTYRAAKEGATEYQAAKARIRGGRDSPFLQWKISSHSLQEFDATGARENGP